MVVTQWAKEICKEKQKKIKKFKSKNCKCYLMHQAISNATESLPANETNKNGNLCRHTALKICL